MLERRSAAPRRAGVRLQVVAEDSVDRSVFVERALPCSLQDFVIDRDGEVQGDLFNRPRDQCSTDYGAETPPT